MHKRGLRDRLCSKRNVAGLVQNFQRTFPRHYLNHAFILSIYINYLIAMAAI